MGRGKVLTMNEKSEIVRLLGGGATISEIADKVQRHKRTINKFVTNSNRKRQRTDKGTFRSINNKELLKIKRSLTHLSHKTNKTIFTDAINRLPTRPTRCKVLRSLAKLKKGEI